MSRNHWNTDEGPFNGLYRDRENGWIFGICAGIADRYNLHIGVVRIIACACLVFFSWLTIAAYLLIALIVRSKPLIYSGRRSEYEFWRRFGRDEWRHS